ncbi:MAG: hypothetical protein WC610_02670 [Patescibacteria group bacterium]
MKSLEKELKLFSDVNCLNIDDITGIDLKRIYTKDNKYYFDDIDSVFIRYPYDLIPPHSQTYNLRENTEYLKTIALILSNKSINPIQLTWKYRNRLLSLKLADKIGLNVPTSIVTKKIFNCKDFYKNKSTPISKAIGNCFVSDKTKHTANLTSKYFTLAEDDGDRAMIYPAQQMTINNLEKYLQTVKVVFLQKSIINIVKEFRVYLIGKKLFIFSRLNNLGKIDKSEELYIQDNFSNKYSQVKKKLLELKEKMKLGYLCLDIIETRDDLFLIDINPSGSLPPYRKYPAVTKELARLIRLFKGS